MPESRRIVKTRGSGLLQSSGKRYVALKILQVATLVTPEGAYGGPVRVAVNQTRTLLELGHEVVLAAGAQGFRGKLPRDFDGVPIQLFRATQVIPKLGFATTIAPRLFQHVRHSAADFDAVHIHLARDLVTLPVARWLQGKGLPYVAQTHGMIGPSKNPLALPLDLFWTKSVLTSAGSVLHLTDDERRKLRKVAGLNAQYRLLQNGVPIPSPPHVGSGEASIEVLFMARLHPRKRPLAFIEMAEALTSEFPDVSFRLVGPDEGDGAASRAALDQLGKIDTINWEGPVSPEKSSERLAQASIYVLPSINEPFPMAVLEAMALGKPVIVTDTCGLAEEISHAKAGYVVDDSIESLISAVHDLLSDEQLRQNMGQNAKLLVQSKFTMENVAKELESIYAHAASGAGKKS